MVRLSKPTFVSMLLLSFAGSCKTTRPTIDIAENAPKKSSVSNNASKKATNSLVKGKNPPFETPQGPIVKPMDPTIATEGDTSTALTALTLFGYGLYESVIGSLENKSITDKPISTDLDATYAGKCRPFKPNEWVASGIQIAGGKLFGIDLYFSNEICEGKAGRSMRDEKSVSFTDYDRSLTLRKVAVTIDAKGFTITYPNSESTLLNKLSFAESKLGTPLKAGELPMGNAIVKSGLGLYGFVQKTLGELSEDDRLVDAFAEDYGSACKLFGSNESYFEAIKIQDGLIRGANIFFGNRTCTGHESDHGADSKGVSFADYTKALKGFGTSVSKVNDQIIVSDRSPDGYARQTIFRRIPFSKTTAATPIIEGLGTSKFVLDTIKPPAKSNNPAHELADGIFVRNCQKFTDKTWKSTGIYLVDGMVYGIDLYFGNADCSGKALGGVSDQYNVHLTDYMKALKTLSIDVSLEDENKFILDYATGASVEYVKSSATLP